MTSATLPSESPPTFEVLPLSRETLGALAEMGYTHPTPVQRAVFDPACRGIDLVVQARTGTGKTAAFGLPIIESIVRRQVAKAQVLVLCPTRELALQVTKELDRLGTPRGVHPVSIYGGAPMDRQVQALRTGAQVIVGTPGRVLDHLNRQTLDPSDIRMVVLDEADEMLSMGFERELSAILEHLPESRQTLLFSATIPSDIERIARDRLHNPEFLTLSGDHVGALEVLHYVYLVAADKVNTLMRVIEVDNPESAIIFCNTRAETERVAEALERQGFPAAWLNGDLPQVEREQVMHRTREGKLRFLVATDVAARGIDITHLTHVICYDFPETPERYVHRTGRTGRAGRTGTAISLITPRDIGNLYLLRLTYKIRPIERQLPTAGELKTRAETDLVQLLADAFSGQPMHPDDLALARRLLSHDDAEHIVAGLVRDHLGARPEAAEEAAAARRAKVEPIPQVKSPTHPESRPETAAPVTPARPPEDAALSNWTPPSEPGDDQPIFDQPRPTSRGGEARTRARLPDRVRPAGSRTSRERFVERTAPIDDVHVDPSTGITWLEESHVSDTAEGREQSSSSLERSEPNTTLSFGHAERDDVVDRRDMMESIERRDSDAPFVEVFVTAGRRDGVEASDFQRVLSETAHIAGTDVGRIRVRDRNSFVSVRREVFERAVAALNGATLGGKPVQAEAARARS